MYCLMQLVEPFAGKLINIFVKYESKFCDFINSYIILYVYSDVCLCDQDFYGEDCSMPVTMAPTIYSTSQSLFTPTSSTSPSTQSATVMVYGEAFISSDSLTCHVTAEQGQVITVSRNNVCY